MKGVIDDSAVIFEFGPFTIVVDERQLLFDKKQVSLTPKAFDTLLMLVQHSGQVIEKKDIMDHIWPDTFVEEATLAQNIFTLRKVLGENTIGVQYIETIPKRGYRFVAQVKVSGRNSVPPHTALPRGLPSIAILPFDTLLTDKDDDFIGLGLADALITKLSNINQIIVRPTRAIRKYRTNDIDPLISGNELSVDFILTGTIQNRGNKIRVTVQLICVGDSTTLWSEKFDETDKDIFSVQDSISEEIIKILALKLTTQEQEHVTKVPTNNQEAYASYLKGRFYWGKWTQEGFQKGVALFQQAVKLDPNFALAHAAIADAFNTLSFYGYLHPKPAFQAVNRAALQAIQLDPSSAEAHAALAVNNFAFTWDWITAEQEFLKAIAINPGNPAIYHSYAAFLLTMGRFSEARENLKIALELDPLSPLLNASMAYPSYFSRQYDQAILELQQAIELEPYFPLSYKILGDTYTEKQMYTEARIAYQKSISLIGPHPIQLAYVCRSLALAGDISEAENICRQLKTISETNYVSPTSFAVVYSGLGEKEKALDLLEEAYRDRCNNLVFVNIQPAFDILRATPRFARLIEMMGFEPVINISALFSTVCAWAISS